MKLIKTKFFFSEFFNEVEPKSLPKVFNTFYCLFIFKGDIKVIYLWPTSIPNLQIELTGIYFGFDSGINLINSGSNLFMANFHSKFAN